MEGKDFKCTGNCLNCLPAQRAYCASQHAYSNMKVLDSVMEKLLDIQKKLEAMQNSEASVFDPNAQEGDGVVTIDAPIESTSKF